jgi:hypothetical protein
VLRSVKKGAAGIDVHPDGCRLVRLVLPERILLTMRLIHTAGRAALPLVAATFAVGLLSAPAWASTPISPTAPPPWVRAADCRHSGGHLVQDRRDRHRWICVGGRWNGRDTRF